jgi:hypothetical protein
MACLQMLLELFIANISHATPSTAVCTVAKPAAAQAHQARRSTSNHKQNGPTQATDHHILHTLHHTCLLNGARPSGSSSDRGIDPMKPTSNLRPTKSRRNYNDTETHPHHRSLHAAETPAHSLLSNTQVSHPARLSFDKDRTSTSSSNRYEKPLGDDSQNLVCAQYQLCSPPYSRTPSRKAGRAHGMTCSPDGYGWEHSLHDKRLGCCCWRGHDGAYG